MKIKAVTNFAGAVSMHEGETRTCEKTAVIQELIQAGYVEVLEPDPGEKKETAQKASKKNEDQ